MKIYSSNEKIFAKRKRIFEVIKVRLSFYGKAIDELAAKASERMKKKKRFKFLAAKAYFSLSCSLFQDIILDKSSEEDKWRVV